MAVSLNHTIVAAHDHEASSKFLAEILGLPPPLRIGPFAVVTVGDTSLDFMNVKVYRGGDGEVVSQHYAFLVTEAEFDEILRAFGNGTCPIGPIRVAASRTRSTNGMVAAGSTSKIPTGMFSKRSRGPTAVAARRRLARTHCSRQTRNHRVT